MGAIPQKIYFVMHKNGIMHMWHSGSYLIFNIRLARAHGYLMDYLNEANKMYAYR